LKDNGGERTHVVEGTSCYNCENAKVGQNFKGISNHYKMGKCCHRKSGKSNSL
jgi:hypothetical protein